MTAMVLEALGIVFLVQLVATFAMLGFASARDSRERRQRARIDAINGIGLTVNRQEAARTWLAGQKSANDLRAERNELNGRQS